MALNLPGFYFDQEKNRYFPLNSKIVKPLGALNNVPESSAPTQPAVIIPQRNTRSRHALRVENGLASRSIHQQFIGVSVLSNALLDVTFNAPWDYIGVKLTSLAVSNSNILAGDRSGMLYLASTEHPEESWTPIYHLASPISSVHIYESTYFAASLGPKPQILVSSQEYMASLNLSSFHDIWTVEWYSTGPLSTSATIGMKQQAVYLPTIESLRGLYMMPTKSDIFSVHKRHAQIFTGARNGSVRVFDIRTPATTATTLWGPRARSNQGQSVPKTLTSGQSHSAAVTNLCLLHDWQLLLSAMDGTLGLYDIRFMGSNQTPNPITWFEGHVNSRTQGLGFVVDTTSSVVLAAGEDRKIRAWYLKTGDLVSHPERPHSLLQTEFPGPVQGISFSGTNEDQIYAASERSVSRFKSKISTG